MLDAGQKLLEDKGWEGFTVQEVSRRAGVSIGSIYARAPSKESLILAVYDRAMERIAAESRALTEDDSRWEGLSARELIMGATREMAAQMLRHRKILGVFMNRAPVDPAIAARGDQQVKELAERWEGLLLRHRREFKHPDPQLAIEVSFRIAFATIARRIARGSSFGAYRVLDDKRLVEEVGRAIAAYLLERPQKSGAAGRPT